MKHRPDAVPMALALVGLAGALSLSGCGDFWQNPNGTSTGTTATTTTLTTSPTSGITTTTSVILTAKVSPSAATGTVNFSNNSTQIGTGTLSSGSASYTTTFSTAGTESLTATYTGNSTYASSQSTAVTLTVTAPSGSSLPRAFIPSSKGRETNLVLDPANTWTVTANSYLHDLSGVALGDGAVQNIDGGGHCVYYSGTLYFYGGTSDARGVYPLSGGGFLAPAGTTGLACD